MMMHLRLLVFEQKEGELNTKAINYHPLTIFAHFTYPTSGNDDKNEPRPSPARTFLRRSRRRRPRLTRNLRS